MRRRNAPIAPRVPSSPSLISMSRTSTISLFFFFNDTATTEIYTLSLHDALPISNNSSSSDHTTRTYNPDDTINSVTDARGASATYSYNNNRYQIGRAHV